MITSFPRAVDRPMTVGELVAVVPAEASIIGDPSVRVAAVAPLGQGQPGCLVFCRFECEQGIAMIRQTQATAIVTSATMPAEPGRCFIRVADPRGWFIAALGALFAPERPTGIDSSARVAEGARIGRDVSIGPFSVIEAGAEIGDGSRIGAFCHVTGRVTLGRSVIVQAHCALGGTGLSFHEEPDGKRVFFPHFGRSFIGDGASLGSQTVVVAGIIEDTVIGSGSMIGNQVNVGHNCQIGDMCFISSGTVLAGSAALEEGVIVGAGARITSHVRIGAGAVVGIGSVVVKPVPVGGRVFGNPAQPLRTMARF